MMAISSQDALSAFGRVEGSKDDAVTTLLISRGPQIGMRYRLDSERTTLGRGVDCEIQLLDTEVSRVHAAIERVGQGYRIVDLGSRNGVFVNRRRVEVHELKRNDEIILGSTHILFDAAFEIRNAEFSEGRVCIAGATDETAPSTGKVVSPQEFDRVQRGMLQLFERIKTTLASPRDNLPALCEEVLRAALDLVKGERGSIMRWDGPGKDLIPVIAVSPGDELSIDKQTVSEVFRHRRPVIRTSVILQTDYGTQERRESLYSVICAPVGTESQCEGVVYVDATGRERFGLSELGILSGIASLLYLLMQHTRMFDAFAAERPKPTRMIGDSQVMRALREKVVTIAQHDSAVLITGETGTGKELLAREIHALSPRNKGPFVAINCSAVPETLFESELFGHEKGAFTGATELKRGKIEIAAGGTLFLDEIGEMSTAVQPKLLRFLEERVFFRVGGTRTVRSDVRIIAATNADLRRMVERGGFRSDLMFRLNVLPLELPPLRERREDIPPLATHFLEKFAREMKKPVTGISRDAIEALIRHDWPGNVRELANTIERAVLLAREQTLRIGDIAVGSQGGEGGDGAWPGPRGERETSWDEAPGASLEETERRCILAALQRNDWNKVQAAKELGIHRNTLMKRVRKYRLKRSQS